MSINRIKKSWGEECMINPSGEKRVRLYWNSKKNVVTIDFSVNGDQEWSAFKKKQEKYGVGPVKVPCDPDKLEGLIEYFSSF